MLLTKIESNVNQISAKHKAHSSQTFFYLYVYYIIIKYNTYLKNINIILFLKWAVKTKSLKKTEI
jgi:hypothetical protein